MGSRAMKMRPGTRNKRRYLPVLYVLVILAAIALAGYCAVYSLCQSWLQDLPDYQDSSSYNLAEKTRVYASDNTTLLAEFYLEDREPLDSLNEINQYVRGGTVATEDVRFYEHNGIDVMGILRALAVNFTGGEREGASTITQQFVRNTVLSSEANEQTIKRKVREAYISLKLEQVYSKDEILLMYLNTINYGSGAYGIEAASQKYFSCSNKDLTLAQAATLIGIPQSPTNNNPIDNPESCLARRNVVLNRMLTNGYITQAEYDAAVQQPLGLKVKPADTTNGIYAYPYFTSYVRQWLLDNYSESEVFKGGLTVTTTLDVNAQNAAESAARQKEAAVDDDMEVAMVAVDPSNGYIKALVGGRDYYTDQYNLATQAVRSPGSSFKTYTLLAAIEDGVNPNSTYVNCSATATIGTWPIENYDKISYGTRTIASAFAVSSNTGFARIVTMLGPDKVAEMAKRCGVQTSLLAVPAITLGGDSVTVRDMAAGYATIASGGIQRDTVVVSKITDNNDKVIYQPTTTGKQVISQEVANAAEQVMEGVITNGTGTAARLSTGQVAAGKTGTSDNFYDSWFCGITPQYSVAIWLGCREQRTMNSNYTAASVFSSFLDVVLANAEIEKFPMANAAKPTYRTLTTAETTILAAGSTSGSSDGTTNNDANSNSKTTDTSNSSTTTNGTSTGGTTGGGTSGGTTGGGTSGGTTGGTGGGTSGGTTGGTSSGTTGG